MAATYTITHDKGTTFKFYALYKDSTGDAIDLASQTARMQVRRSPNDNRGRSLYHWNRTMNNAWSGTVFAVGSVTHGGATGVFTIGGTNGTTGTGDIKLNAGVTGATGTTGGIFVEFDGRYPLSFLPTGKMFYDIELVEGEEVTRLVEGKIRSDGKRDALLFLMNKLEIETSRGSPRSQIMVIKVQMGVAFNILE